jgi:hypothetical protein
MSGHKERAEGEHGIGRRERQPAQPQAAQQSRRDDHRASQNLSRISEADSTVPRNTDADGSRASVVEAARTVARSGVPGEGCAARCINFCSVAHREG